MTDIGIARLAYYVPPGLHTSEHMARETGIPQWVLEEKFGLRQKHRAGPDEHVAAMAVKAARQALDGFDPERIDALVYFGSEYKDYYVWSAAAEIQRQLGARRAYCFEIKALCAGAPMALNALRAMMRSDPGLHHVLAVAATKEGELINYQDPQTRFLFNIADGAAAVLLERGHSRNVVLESALITDGTFARGVFVPLGGRYLEVPDPAGMKDRLDPISLPNFLACVREAVDKSGYAMRDIRFLACTHLKRSFHKAILEALALSDEQTFYLEDYGHVQAADQLIALVEGEKRGRLQPGDLAVLVAAGTGYTWGATCVRWG